MLSVDEALALVLQHATPLPPVPTVLGEARGRVLAETVVSNVDSPPHDKSIVDGFALIAADIKAAGTELKVLEEVTAGAVPTHVVEPGTATRIMTGAPLPRGADAVVMVEQTKLADGAVTILQSPVKPGQNIMRRAAAMSRGQTVLSSGRQLRAIEIGLLAEIGRPFVAAIPPPRVAVLTTGNELAAPSVVPIPATIRNSNGPMLHGLAKQAGAHVSDLGIARDDATELARDINAGLSRDVLVLSGGVSAGTLDLVPQVLAKLGVTQVFRKINLKPGKPLWFGHKPRCAGHDTLVFGLPGNPVSSLVCFELFVRPAIQKLRGLPPTGLPRGSARLAQDHQHRGDRDTYWPAKLEDSLVTPLAWQGSGDLRTLTDANCLAHFPAGDRPYQKGEAVDILLFDAAS